MKIIHLCLCSFYIEGFGYQENLIPKYNKIDGHDITIIASRFTFNKENGRPDLTEAGNYINGHGIKVVRIDYKSKLFEIIGKIIKAYSNTYELLVNEEPDLIFIHGIQFWDIKEVIRYKKSHPQCKVVGDIHASYDNSAQNLFSKFLLHKIIWRKMIRSSLPYIDKIFAIAPGCKTFAKEMYNIPEEKFEYLYLGADTLKINFEKREEIKNCIREKLDIKETDFVLITGGKLSKEKNTKLLLDSLKKVNSKNVKLIIFGVFSDDIKSHLLKKVNSDERVKYIGWLDGEDVYEYYLASDAAIFPGTKSALWEQAICSGLPIICKRWKGMEYVDVGGNCIFLDDNNVDKISESINLLLENRELYNNMKEISETKGYETFSYERISRQAIK